MSFPHRRRVQRRAPLLLFAALGLALAACGAEADPEPEAAADAEVEEAGEELASESDEEAEEPVDDGELLQIVATTSIIGDLVENITQGDAEVTVLMAPGVDPHGYEPSASDGRILREADLIVANGLMLEENLVSVLEAVEEEGGNVLSLAEQLDPIDFDWDGPGHSHGHDDHDDDHGHSHDDDHGHGHDDDHGHSHDDDHGHSHDDDHGHGHDDDHGHGHDDDHGHSHDDDHGHDDHDDHAHADEDPHFWFDPLRTADGVGLIAEAIAEVDERLDTEEWLSRAEAYAAELEELDAEMSAMFETIPDANRVLVTNHDALGYLAVRYDFEVLGTVIPGSSTQAEADARGFAELVETVERAGVEVVFAENTDSTVLAEQLASEVVGRGDLDVEVVELYTGSLGEPGSGADSYLGMLRTTSMLITEALGGTV